MRHRRAKIPAFDWSGRKVGAWGLALENALQYCIAVGCEVNHSDIKGKFCTSCGEKIIPRTETLKCKNDHPLEANQKFCTECGETAATQIRSRRKSVVNEIQKTSDDITPTASSTPAKNTSVASSTFSNLSYLYDENPSPIIDDKKSNKKVIGIVSAILSFVVLIGLINGNTVSTTMVTIELTVYGEDNCFNLSWGYSDIPGAQVVLTKDGEQVGFGNYNSLGTSSILGCKFTATISDVPMDGESYGVSMASGRRGTIYNTKAELESSDWTFVLSLGNL